MSSRSIEFLSPAEIPPDIREFWCRRICEQDVASAITRTPEWFGLMSSGLRGEVAVLRSAGTTRIVAPLLFQPWPMRYLIGGRAVASRALATVKICGGDLIDDGFDSQDVAALLDAIIARHPQIEGAWFDKILSNERFAALTGLAHPRVFVHAIYRDMPHYRLHVPTDTEGFKALRSPESVKKIQGRERALSRAIGPVSLLELRGESDWLPYEQRVVQLMNQTWQANLLGHGFSMDEMKGIAALGWLRLFLLMAGEQLAAVAMCYEAMDTLLYEKIGYDQAFAKHSPGTILLYRILDEARAKGIRYVDFGEGEADYKRQLSNMTIRVGSCLFVRSDLSKRMQFAIHKGWHSSMAAVTAVSDRLGLKSRIKALLKKRLASK